MRTLKMPSSGTPKTLKQAIENGFEQATAIENYGGKEPAIEILALHIQDFLAQKFNAAMLSESSIEALWNKIIEKK